MSQPRRIQRKRSKGWKMPAGSVYVGRPTPFGNPWRVGQTVGPHDYPMSAHEAVDNYRKWMLANQAGPERYRVPVARLRGKNLACWCPLNQPCHADVLLEIASGSRGIAAKEGAKMENKVLNALQVAKQTIDGWTRDSDGRVTVHPDVVSKAVNAAIAELEGQ